MRRDAQGVHGGPAAQRCRNARAADLRAKPRAEPDAARPRATAAGRSRRWFGSAAMRLRPFALAVALAFWGWRSGHYFGAALMAALAEGPRFVALRFELKHAEFSRVADLCTVLFVALLGWLFLSVEGPRTARAVLTGMLWLPAVLLPILLAQRLSISGRLPLSALFRYLRKLRATDPNYREIAFDLAPAAFVICLVPGGLPHAPDPE